MYRKKTTYKSSSNGYAISILRTVMVFFMKYLTNVKSVINNDNVYFELFKVIALFCKYSNKFAVYCCYSTA